jgi:O-antigen/teichoic acid export membrane protein
MSPAANRQNRNSTLNLLMQGFRAASGIIIMACLARYLTVEAFGTFYFLLSIVMMLAIPTTMGLPILVSRETAAALKVGDHSRIRQTLRTALTLVAVTSLTIIAAGWLAIRFTGVIDTNKTALMLGLLMIPITALANLRTGFLRGLGAVVLSQIPEMLVRPVVFITIVLLLLFVGRNGQSAEDAMVIQLFAAISSFVAGLLLLRHAMPNASGPAYEDVALWPLVMSSITLGASTGLAMLNSNIDVLMIGILRSELEVGLYRPAVSMANFLLFGLQAAGWTIMPGLASAYRQNDMAELERQAVRAARFGFVTAALFASFILLFGKWILVSFFGPEFEATYPSLAILALGQLANSAFGSLIVLNNMTQNERITLRSALAAVLVNIILNALFVPSFGIIAAAAATVASLMVNKTILLISVKRRLGIKCAVFFV